MPIKNGSSHRYTIIVQFHWMKRVGFEVTIYDILEFHAGTRPVILISYFGLSSLLIIIRWWEGDTWGVLIS
jgi:hypothetical protein